MNKILSRVAKALPGFAIGLMVLTALPASAVAALPGAVFEFTASITPTTTVESATQGYTLTVTNSNTSNRIIRSAGVVIPAGWSVANLAATGGWTPTNLGGQIELQKDGPGTGLQAGESVVLTFDGTAPAGATSSEWTTTAFQGNHFALNAFTITSAQPTVDVTLTPVPVYVITQAADTITETNGTMHALNGDFAAIGHSYWVSTSTFSTSSPSIPAGVYSTPDFGGIAADAPFGATPISLVTTSGIPTNMNPVTPNTTYYFVAWSNVGGTWHPGDMLSFTTLAHVTAVSLPVHVSPADNSVRTTAAQTEIDWTDSTSTNPGPVTYIYQSANNPATNPDGSFVSPVYTSGPLSVSSISTLNTPEGVYYWHVKASDGIDTSAWTTPWKITVDNSPAPCLIGTSTFDDFTLGSVNGQSSWKATNPAYDHAVVANNYGFPTFGCKSLRISDAVTSGSFGDWIFAAPMADSVGEAAATNGGFPEGTRKNHFEAQFDIASTQPTVQAGLHVSVSPDRGDGSRMSYLRFEDQADGVHVFFVDTPHPSHVAASVDFTETDIATLARTDAHTIKITLDAIDGPTNDVVNVYVDGLLVHTGTSWEDYYRYDPEASAEQTPRLVKTLILQARGTATPANSGKGFLFDNFSFASSELQGAINVTKYVCPADTVVTRSANGVGQTVPAGCVPQADATFGYVHGAQTDANAPYPELGQPFTAAGATDEDGILNISGLPSAGRYLVAETNSEGAQLASGDILGLYCIGDGDTSDNNDNQELTFVPPGGTVQCVAYNKPAPVPPPTTATIIVRKATIPAGSSQDFNYSLTQTDGETTTVIATTTASTTGAGTIENVLPGTYKLVEGDTDFWAYSSASCTVNDGDNSEPTGAESPSEHAMVLSNIVAGATYDCTFTNVANGGGIKIVKKVVASDGVTPAPFDNTDFTIHVTGYDADQISQNDDVTHDSIAGTYTVSEDADSDYELLSISPDNDESLENGGQFTVTNGTTTVVTITNKQRASSTGTIIVHKNANPSDSGQNFEFTLVKGSDTVGTTTASSTASSTFANLPEGTYTLTETQVPGWNYGGVVCLYDGESEGESIDFGKTIYLDADDVVECTFTNTSTKGSIRVVKNVVDSNGNEVTDTHAFGITLNGTTTKSVAEGADAIYTDLDPEGTYTIAENTDPNYDLFSISPTSTVSVVAGTTTVVTITNKQHAVQPGFTGGGGPIGGGGGPTGGSTSPNSGGQVLGASTDVGTTTASTTPGAWDINSGPMCKSDWLLTSYLKIDKNNPRSEVVKLQAFLNTQDLGVKLTVTGIFDTATEQAVKLLQLKFAADILGPWVNAGRLPANFATGYVYKTTLRWINHLICTTLPLAPVQL